jgi:hypothetical protein
MNIRRAAAPSYLFPIDFLIVGATIKASAMMEIADADPFPN